MDKIRTNVYEYITLLILLSTSHLKMCENQCNTVFKMYNQPIILKQHPIQPQSSNNGR